jgi:hypothetical protein
MLIKGWSENPVNGIILLIGFYGSMIINSAIMVIIFSATLNLGQKVNRLLIAISVIILIIFGFYQLFSGIAEFL